MNNEAVTIEPKVQGSNKTLFGFWVYLMTDVVLFASLFATYAVLRDNTAGGPSGASLFSLPFVLVETLILLTSSFTCGMALLAARSQQKRLVIYWLSATFILGLTFLGLELSEFRLLIIEGNGFRESGFLSSYFTLVGTHGLHIFVGLIWMAVAIFLIIKRGLGRSVLRRLTMLSLFWHFLDIIWIFIFTIVYLLGAVKG